MTRQILMLIALGVAAPVHADVSDSGNLTIGGTGVIQGTMTVQGGAFSVGGSSFTVAGGSATVANSLTAKNIVGTASGTFNAVFGNGSALTALTGANISAGALGSGVIASSVAATGVGAKSTCGSATISCAFDVNVDGRITRVSSATISGTGGSGGLIFIASVTVTAVTAVTFSSLAADTQYSVVFSLTQNTSASNLFIRFNGDSGSNYRTAGFVTVDSSINASFGSTGTTQAAINGGNQMNSASQAMGEISFASMPGTNTTITGNFNVTHFDGNERNSSGGFRYANSAISSFSLNTNAGTVTGNVALYRRDKS
jgi:hypothetical protein